MKKFYSHINVLLDCKNIEKAKKLKKRIEQTLHLTIIESKFTQLDKREFKLNGYCILEYPTKEEAVFNWLFYLDLLGYNWQIKAPDIYEDFFSFEAERDSIHQKFRIPGMIFCSFELTDRNLDYYDSAPFSENQKIEILDSRFTLQENINGLTGHIDSIGVKTDRIWHFGIYIPKIKQTYFLSEKELKPITKETKPNKT